MNELAHTLFKRDIMRIGRVVVAAERNRVPPAPPRPKPFQAAGRPSIVVILLDDCPSGNRVQASILEDLTTNETQVFSTYGIASSGYYRLGFQPLTSGSAVEWTSRLNPLTADADTIRLALEALPSITPGDVEVNFGVVTTSDGVAHVVHRFSVTFQGKFEGLDIPLMEYDDHVGGAHLEVDSTHILEDTGRVEWVREVLGVGTPTPIKAGARAICHWIHGIGYVIAAVEARDLGDYGLAL